MDARDFLGMAWATILGHRLRSVLTMVGISIGIASVILLTSIGEGTRQFVLGEFTQFGTNVIAVNPGKALTTGSPGALGGTYRKLTVEDAEALRRVAGVENVVPVIMGTARVQAGERGRSVFVYGVNSEIPDVWKFEVRQGRFLPQGDPRRGAPVVVLGPKLKREIFGEENALGRFVRVGGQRFLVIGVMAPKGLLLGFDIDDSAYIPVARARALFDEDGLIEIDMTFSQHSDLDRVVADVRSTLMARHEDEEDFSITTQTEMMDVFGRVMNVISAAAGGIGAISLVVGAIGILTIMWISVNERRTEIGLAKAIGAGSGQILGLFLLEASLLSLIGGVIGVGLGMGIARIVRLLVPGLPVQTPVSYVLAALAVSLLVGLASGALPARRAARLNPVESLHAE
jgi:putative ABC transport system permease protein